MRVFVAGATGALGRPLLRQLAAGSHEVVGLSRDDGNDRTIRELGGEPVRADLFDAASLARAAAGAEVVVHAATKIPSKTRVRPKDWAENDRIRREGTRALLAATAEVGARLYLQQSIVWLARPPDASPFDETSAHRDRRPEYRSMIDGERLVEEASARLGFAAVVLRCGMFYGADSAQTRIMGQGLARGRLPILGDGSAEWRLVHTEDAAGAFVTAAEAGEAGLWHVVDDEAVTVATFLRAMAERLGARPPRRIPRFLARLAVGSVVTSVFTDSTRTSNARIRTDLGWRPRYPTYREGLDAVLEAWRREGFPPE